MYSNSKGGKKAIQSRPRERKSGEFDDFNTVVKKSKKLKYRGLKTKKTRNSFSRSKSRKVKAKRERRMKDFYEKLSKEFDEEDPSLSPMHKGAFGVLDREDEHNFKNNWPKQSRYKF